MGTVRSTLWGELPDWVELCDRRTLGWPRQLRALLESRAGDAVILSGSATRSDLYREMVSAVILRRLRPGVALVIADANWAPRSKPGEKRRGLTHAVVAWGERQLLRASLGPRTHLCVLSSEERVTAAAKLRIDLALVHLTPFCSTIEESELDRVRDLPGRGHVFVGGNTLRDWDLLRAALVGTDFPVRIASTAETGDWPPSVTAGPVSHQEFLELMATSAAVCLPLSDAMGRSTAQQTYLNAMLLKRPVILTEAPGVRDLVTPGVDAVVVPPDPASLRRALETVLAGGPEIEATAARGQQTAAGFTARRYLTDLAEVARDAAGIRSTDS